MDRTTYLALVHREANLLLDEREPLVRQAASGEHPADELAEALERQLTEIVSEVDHLEDVLKWSDLRDVDPALWRHAESWQGVLIGAAMAALVHDVRACAARIVGGELPTMHNIQVD
jgi:hypothetical protein